MKWQGLMIVGGYALLIAATWPWGLLPAALHAAVLLATVKR